jgi:predicted N-acyltransferase
MDGAGGELTLTVIGDLANADRATWDGLANPPDQPYDPFLSWDFLQALEESGCVSSENGWQPAHLIARDAAGAAIGAMPLYAKDHSYGEYVFDHAWADALQREGERYYPKLQCAVPFTPVPGRRIFAYDPAVESALAQAAIGLAQRAGASSVHATFAGGGLAARLAPLGYMARSGLQYHWFNRGYASFEDFLSNLSAQKRKTIRRERARACEHLVIRRLRGTEITGAHWDFFFRC